ncbi:MAG: type II secretion system protein GspG [Desulfobacteraceae bacterium]|nr:type II secretion system protein GspG [Desulfobacteraceae bacterium]
MEILIVMVIVATLSAIAIPVGSKYIDRARNARAIAEIRMLEREITVFSMKNDAYPNGLDDIGQSGLLDTWGNPYEYLNIADLNPKKNMMRHDRFLVPVNSDYDLYSKGKDGETQRTFQSSKARDDIVRANDGEYVGLAGYF